MAVSQNERRNMKTARKLLEELNRHDVEYFLQILAEDFVWKSDVFLPHPEELSGRVGASEGVERLFLMFPDIRFEILHLFAAEDRVVAVLRDQGNRVTGFMGLPEIQAEYTFEHCAILVFKADGKLSGMNCFWDRGWLLEQLGPLPPVGLFGPALGHDSRQILPPAGTGRAAVVAPPPPPRVDRSPAQRPAPDTDRSSSPWSSSPSWSSCPGASWSTSARPAPSALLFLPFELMRRGMEAILGERGRTPRHRDQGDV